LRRLRDRSDLPPSRESAGVVESGPEISAVRTAWEHPPKPINPTVFVIDGPLPVSNYVSLVDHFNESVLNLQEDALTSAGYESDTGSLVIPILPVPCFSTEIWDHCLVD
jgi:hypothetical protein